MFSVVLMTTWAQPEQVMCRSTWS